VRVGILPARPPAQETVSLPDPPDPDPAARWGSVPLLNSLPGFA